MANLAIHPKSHNSEQSALLEMIPLEIVTQLSEGKNSGVFFTVMFIVEILENDLLIGILLI